PVVQQDPSPAKGSHPRSIWAPADQTDSGVSPIVFVKPSEPNRHACAGSLEVIQATVVEAAWAALAGTSACLGGLILDRSGVRDDAIDELERTQVEAALLDARAARDELASVLHGDGLAEALSLDDPDGELVPLASRLRDGFGTVAEA